MSNKIKCALLVASIIFASGCSTLHFDNGAKADAQSSTAVEKWHHNAVLALFEVSNPVNLKDECGDKNWTSVKTELSFANGLISSVVNFFVPVWYPKTVEVSCN